MSGSRTGRGTVSLSHSIVNLQQSTINRLLLMVVSALGISVLLANVSFPLLSGSQTLNSRSSVTSINIVEKLSLTVASLMS